MAMTTEQCLDQHCRSQDGLDEDRLDQHRPDQHRLGLALAVGSAVAYSTAGYFTRLIPLDVWSLLFWRGIFAGGFMLLLMLNRWLGDRKAQTRRHQKMGRPGWLIAGFSTLGMVCFLSALRSAPVADVALIYAVVPFVTAIMAWVALRERSAPRTIGASIVALVGVVMMVGDGWSAGYWRGDLLAFGMTCAMAALTVAIRRFPDVDSLKAACATCFLGSLVALPFADIPAVTPMQLAVLALFGVGQMGLGFLLLMAATKRISAMESALIGALDAPLAPVWVWLAFGEVVSSVTLLGGVLILVAVGGDILLANRPVRRKAAVPG